MFGIPTRDQIHQQVTDGATQAGPLQFANGIAGLLKSNWGNLRHVVPSLSSLPENLTNDQSRTLATALSRPPSDQSPVTLNFLDPNGVNQTITVTSQQLNDLRDFRLGTGQTVGQTIDHRRQQFFGTPGQNNGVMHRIGGALAGGVSQHAPGFGDFFMAFFKAIGNLFQGKGFSLSGAMAEIVRERSRPSMTQNLQTLAQNDAEVAEFLRMGGSGNLQAGINGVVNTVDQRIARQFGGGTPPPETDPLDSIPLGVFSPETVNTSIRQGVETYITNVLSGAPPHTNPGSTPTPLDRVEGMLIQTVLLRMSPDERNRLPNDIATALTPVVSASDWAQLSQTDPAAARARIVAALDNQLNNTLLNDQGQPNRPLIEAISGAVSQQLVPGGASPSEQDRRDRIQAAIAASIPPTMAQNIDVTATSQAITQALLVAADNPTFATALPQARQQLISQAMQDVLGTNPQRILNPTLAGQFNNPNIRPDALVTLNRTLSNAIAWNLVDPQNPGAQLNINAMPPEVTQALVEARFTPNDLTTIGNLLTVARGGVPVTLAERTELPRALELFSPGPRGPTPTVRWSRRQTTRHACRVISAHS